MHHSWRTVEIEIQDVSTLRVVNVLNLVGHVVVDFTAPFKEMVTLSTRSPSECSYENTEGVLLADYQMLGPRDISWIGSSKFLEKFDGQNCSLREMADSDVVLDEYLRNMRPAETIGRWLNESERVALVTGVLVEEWDPSGHNNLTSVSPSAPVSDASVALISRRNYRRYSKSARSR